ncbi:MAG: penicillin-binding protein 2 [Chlamydiales bacterium]
MGGFFSLLVVRFFQIQIVEGEKWTRLAKSQHQLRVTIPAKRGRFFAKSRKVGHPNEEIPLVVDVEKFHFYVDPLAIPSGFCEEIARNIAQNLEYDRIGEERILHELTKPSRSRKIEAFLPIEKRDRVRDWWKGFARANRLPRNALFFIEDRERSYPYGKLMGQILHTVTRGVDEKLPTGGLELYFDKLLKGKDGSRLLLRSPRHAMESGIVFEEAKNGQDIHLTIDPYIQAIAEDEVEKAVKKTRAKSGWALMMDPHTGEIMAYAQYPFFYPSNYNKFFNDDEMMEATRLHAFSDSFEPGSTMKAISSSIMLFANEEVKARGQKPIFDPQEMIPCDRRYFKGRSKPLTDVRTHRFLNLDMAIQKSSNVYLGQIVERIIDRLGPEWLRDQMIDRFGLGQKSGIELPSESPGFVPRPGRLYPSGRMEWSAPTPYSLMMGYNLTTTGIQMVRAFSMIVNGGKLVKPTLVQAQEPVQKIPYEICQRLKQSLRFVTKPGGSGTRADIHGYTEMGKSSTTEKLKGGKYSKRVHMATFLGCAPATNPRFVLMVSIDEPEYRFIPGYGMTHYGGKSAAPVFSKIGLRTLKYLGVAPDDPTGYPRGDPRSDLSTASWMREAKELKELYDAYN